MIKFIVVLSVLVVLLLPNEIRKLITIIFSIIWVFCTIYEIIKLLKYKGDEIVTTKYQTEPPNNNYSSYIRYLYKRKVDYKAFVSTILELILKKSISFVRYNGTDYYLVNNKKDEKLSKSEESVKKMLFKDIVDGDKVSLNAIKRTCSNNSGYIYSVYKDFKMSFEYECAYNKYFKSNKKIIEELSLYLIGSIILSIYNIFITNYIWLSLIMILVVGYMCNYLNDIKRIEDDVKCEYKEWLKFRNYLKKEDNELDELDTTSLENYALYAYVLDCYDEFINVLNKRKSKDKDAFNDSVILTLMYSRIFDDVDYIFKTSIYKLNFNSKILFSKNKGRR